MQVGHPTVGTGKYCVCETTCVPTGEVYIGCTASEKVTYVGSGITVGERIEQYGRDAFERRDLFRTDDCDTASAVESELIKVAKNLFGDVCLNRTIHGIGVRKTPEQTTSKRLKATTKWTPELRAKLSKKMSGKPKKPRNHTCEHCGAGPMQRSHYIRWHGARCRNKPKNLLGDTQ